MIKSGATTISVPQQAPPPLPTSATISQPQSQHSKLTQTQPQPQPQPQSQHQPYSASLVNSGFGFGFDLHGGELDNQLTFIVNVQPNGDASRKGLKDGNLISLIRSLTDGK